MEGTTADAADAMPLWTKKRLSTRHAMNANCSRMPGLAHALGQKALWQLESSSTCEPSI